MRNQNTHRQHNNADTIFQEKYIANMNQQIARRDTSYLE